MDDNADRAPIVPIPAATLVLFRHREGQPPELLVVERSAKMAFAGGAIVFPGGRIDPDDHLLAERYDLDPEEAAARIAAIRETLEESGIAIGFRQTPGAAWLEMARRRLHAHEPFSAMLDEGDHALDVDALVPFARWCPPFREARVFDTRFYIALAPDDAPDPVVDETENVSSYWSSAQDVLDAADSGKCRIIFPTRRNLERLALFAHFDAAEAHARSIPVELVAPQIVTRGDRRFLTIPTHLGYPITEEALDTAMRG